MLKQKKVLVAFAVLPLLLLTVGFTLANAETDWKGDPKWGDSNHGDNNPSEHKFWQVAEHKKLHSLAKCIDHMECKDSQIGIENFQETKAWTNATEDEKICILESKDLGNTLVDYEILDCYKNPDYYNER